MFKDVISTGWWRIHLIILFIGFVPPFFMIIIGYLADNLDDDLLAVSLLWLSCAIVYLIIFRTVVWVIRGFKKS